MTSNRGEPAARRPAHAVDPDGGPPPGRGSRPGLPPGVFGPGGEHGPASAAPALRPGPLRASVACAVFGALLATYWLVYRVAFDAPFYFDSVEHLFAKSNLHMVELSRRSLDAAIRFDFGSRIYRPLSYLSLALTHYFWGLEPRAYRIGNLVVHWAAGVALLFLFRAVLHSPRVREAGPEAAGRWLPVSLLAVALWGLHPVQTNVVTYEIQRMASLSGLFVFLSVAAHLRGRSGPGQWSWGWGLLSLASLGAAVASKENGVVAVPLAVLGEAFLLPRPTEARARRALVGLSVFLGAAAVAVLAWKLPGLRADVAGLTQVRSFTAWERLLTQATLQPRYALLLLVPDARFLTLDADVSVVRSLWEPAAAASVLAVALALALAVRVRRRHPLLAFGVLWFFGAQIVEGTLIPLELYFEHRLYVPSAFAYLGLAWAALAAWARGGRQAAAATLACAVFLGAEGWGTHQRNVTWSDPVRFWADAVRKEPRKPRPRINLGASLLHFGRHAEAKASLERALALGGDEGPIYNTLAVVAREQGDLGLARRHLLAALATDPDNVLRAERELASLCVQEGKLDEAIAHLKSVLRRRPADAAAWNLAGTVALLRNDLGRAETYLRRALGYDATLPGAWNNLGVVHFRRKENGLAAACFGRALQLDPERKDYEGNLAKARLASAAPERHRP